MKLFAGETRNIQSGRCMALVENLTHTTDLGEIQPAHPFAGK